MSRLLIRQLAWILGVLAAAAILFLIATAAAFAQPRVISAPDALERLTAGGFVLLDIRSEEEWKETGLAKGAWPVSMHAPDFPQRLRAIFSRHAPDQIGLICATGGRSAYVAEVLEKNGLTGVADVSEGMLGNSGGAGWIARGLPVVSLKDAQVDFKLSLD